MKSVGRPNIVSRQEALSRALEVFWSLGYQRASLPVLEEATGLRRGSLYQLFKDKRALFREALEFYGAEALTAMDRMMPQGAARADILSWIGYHANRAHGVSGERGCLLVETTMEMGPHDALIAETSNMIFAAMLDRLEQAIAGAPDINDPEPSETARSLLAFLEGLRVLGKSGQSQTQVKRSVARTVDALLPPRGNH